VKVAHLAKIERRLRVAAETLLPAGISREATPDIWELLTTDVPELIDAVRKAQGGQRKYCQYCGERRIGLIVASPEDRNTWECRDVDGCDFRVDRKERKERG